MKINHRFDLVTAINAAVFFAVLGYSIYSLFCYAFEFNGHAFYGIPKVQPVFADLRTLTHSSGCSASIDELLKNLIDCDPFSSSFNYTPLSLTLLRILNVDSTSTGVIGLTMGIIAIFTSIFVFFRSISSGLNLKIIFSTLFIGSFPFQLALERGNYDLFIFVLLILFSLFVSSSRHLSGVLAKITITLAAISSFLMSALKVFPAVGITIWYFAQKNDNRIKFGFLWTVLPAILGIVIQFDYIKSILANTPKPNGDYSFGLLALHQGSKFFYGVLLIKLLVIFTIVYIGLKYLRKNQPIKLFIQEKQEIFNLSFFIVAPVYFLSRSFDNRLIFLVFMLPLILNLHSELQQNRTSKLLSLRQILGASIIFVAYEQYVPGTLGKLLSLFSDAVVQPILFAVLVCIVFQNHRFNVLFNWTLAVKRILKIR